jgi:VIT1/CCC1 family predicted Fe2+/Mn2+ transporter
MSDHGHSPEEVRARLARPGNAGLLRDSVYGAIDGAVTTFAIVAGVAGAGLQPHVVVALGVANVLADGFSMAAANYSGIKAEADNTARLRAAEERAVRDHPEGELVELREILITKGLDGPVLDDAVTAIARHKDRWIDMMLVEEYGVSPTPGRPLRAAIVTFVAFLAAGLVPLLPFLLRDGPAFGVSLGLTMAVFFAIGTLKSRWSLAPWWRSGAETFLIGGMAAAIAFVVGTFFRA